MVSGGIQDLRLTGGVAAAVKSAGSIIVLHWYCPPVTGSVFIAPFRPGRTAASGRPERGRLFLSYDRVTAHSWI
jgi:hypothetical protein